VSSQVLEKQRMGVPALLLKISEKTTSGTVLTKGLYEYILSPEVNASKSYILSKPPIARAQRGPTCGEASLETALRLGYPERNIPPARKHALKPTEAEKRECKEKTSLRQVAKQYGSVIGEIFDIHCLEKTAKHFGFNECSVIKEDKDSYIKSLVTAIQGKHTVILPIDESDGFPGDMKGMETHYALAWGFIFKNNQYHFLVTHWGKHYLWSADDLLRSHEQMPDDNPIHGEYYKDREQDYYYPKTKDQSVLERDRRMIPASSLRDFKFTALAIPTQEGNFLSLDECKPDDKAVYNAVKSSDAITLKLLAEAGANLKASFSEEQDKTVQKIAEENKDTFSLSVLKAAAALEEKRESREQVSLPSPIKRCA
jgi:hypothetical protein